MENFLIEYGIFALAFALFVDDLGVPFPTSTVVFTSAVLARTNPEIPLFSLFLVTLIMPPLGNAVLFHWGRRGARTWLKSHGHRIFLTRKKLRKAERFFEKFGEKTIFFGAMITSLRPVLSIIAGSAKMNVFKFMIFHFFGVCIWASFIVGTGYFFGEQIWALVKTNWPVLIGAVVIYFVARVVLWLHQRFDEYISD